MILRDQYWHALIIELKVSNLEKRTTHASASLTYVGDAEFSRAPGGAISKKSVFASRPYGQVRALHDMSAS